MHNAGENSSGVLENERMKSFFAEAKSAWKNEEGQVMDNA